MVRSNFSADEKNDPGCCSSSRRQLALVTPPTNSAARGTITSRYSGFKLPEEWAVEEVPRPDCSRVDKYYYEPGTGLKFRSLRAVEKYINGEEQLTPKPHALPWHNNEERPRYRKMIICGGQMVRLTKETMNESQLPIVASGKTAAKSTYNLPDGWVVEEVARRSSSNSDKYYYEPGSGQKFRSLLAAQRHIAELNEDMPLSAFVAEIKDMKRPLSKVFKLRQGIKKSASCNKTTMRNNAQPSSLGSVPEKVEWVLASSRGDEWKPFVCDRATPDSVKEQWKERFILVMNVDNPDTNNSAAPGYFAVLGSSILACRLYYAQIHCHLKSMSLDKMLHTTLQKYW